MKNLVNALEAILLSKFFSVLVSKFVLTKSRSGLIMGHVGSKSRSLGQIDKNLVNALEAVFNVSRWPKARDNQNVVRATKNS